MVFTCQSAGNALGQRRSGTQADRVAEERDAMFGWRGVGDLRHRRSEHRRGGDECTRQSEDEAPRRDRWLTSMSRNPPPRHVEERLGRGLRVHAQPP